MSCFFELSLVLAVILVVPGALQQDPDRARHQAHREAPQHEENNPEEDHEGPTAGLCSGAASCNIAQLFSEIDILRTPQSLAKIVWGGAKGKSTCR